jgi:hypothetical protein
MNIDTDGDDGTEGWLPVILDTARRFKVLTSKGYTPIGGAGGYRPRTWGKNTATQHAADAAQDYAPPGDFRKFQADATRAGLIAIDELTKEKAAAHGSKDWTGPHIHVQRYPYGRTPSGLYAAAERRRGPMRGIQITEPP